MKFRHLWVVVIALLIAGVAEAADERAWYGGVKTGIMTLSEEGVGEITQGGVLFGYKFVRADWGSIAFEGEYTDTLWEGDLDFYNAEWDGESLAGCFAYRTPGRGYFKGKAGYVDVTARVRVNDLSDEVDDSDFAAGVGFGWKLGKNMALEVEWTRAFFDEDLDFYSFGFNF